jgi:arginyl-tRNA synthetase
VYYVQMAHARICTLMRKKYQSIANMEAGILPREAKPLLLALLQWPDIQEQIVSTYSVHVLYHYTLHLAKLTHHLYAQLPTDELNPEQRDSRGTLWFLTATRLQRICTLLGVDAPMSMRHEHIEGVLPT